MAGNVSHIGSENASQRHTVCHSREASTGRVHTRTIVREAPLVIHVNRTEHYTLMRTPGQDRDLVVGFLFTEGLIDRPQQIHLLRECRDDPNLVEVTLDGAVEGPHRNLVIGSSCGLCGHTDVAGLLASLPKVQASWSLPIDVLYEMPDRVRRAQPLFDATGATHAAALFDARGRLGIVREDIGRHSALDKAIGHALLAALPLSEHGAFLSGRISLELVVKAARAGFPIVAAVSAPTLAAIEAAEQLGITLCGFVRGNDVTVYTHPERIGANGSAPS